MPIDIGREMSLPMEQIIGGPMQALIKAQALAASSTADFINQVGLETTGTPPVTKARTVDFQYEENKPKEDGCGFDTKLIKLSVPLLTIVPVPYIRIEQATGKAPVLALQTRRRIIFGQQDIKRQTVQQPHPPGPVLQAQGPVGHQQIERAGIGQSTKHALVIAEPANPA